MINGRSPPPPPAAFPVRGAVGYFTDWFMPQLIP